MVRAVFSSFPQIEIGAGFKWCSVLVWKKKDAVLSFPVMELGTGVGAGPMNGFGFGLLWTILRTDSNSMRKSYGL